MTDQRTDIVQHGGGDREVGAPMEQRMAMLHEALTNPAVDPAKAVAMAELIFRVEDRDRLAEFNRDKIAAKAAMPAIFKRGENTHQKTKYVKFEDMQRAIDPVLESHNLMLDFEVGNVGNDIAVTPILRHKNGWVERGGTLKGPQDEGPGRSKIQAVGSAVQYLKRYCAEAVLNLVRDGEDNDGAPIREGSLLNDRQQGVLIDAQAQFDAGTYAGWFSRLQAKDKAWLISGGYHAKFGGAPLLPGSTPPPAEDRRQERKPEPESRKEPASPAEAGPTEQPPADGQLGLDQGAPAKPKMTPRQWVDAVKIDIGKCKTSGFVDEYLDGKRDAMNRLKESNEALWQEVIDAAAYKRDELDS